MRIIIKFDVCIHITYIYRERERLSESEKVSERERLKERERVQYRTSKRPYFTAHFVKASVGP